MDPLKPSCLAAASEASRAVLPGEALCPAGRLTEDGAGVRFSISTAQGIQPAFAVRYQGRVYAYLNRCAHQAVPLDWNEGDFFSPDKEFLVCATHGARYHPATGACAGGRCNGQGLIALAVHVHQEKIILSE